MVEPPNVKMIGYNRSTTEPMRVVTFYVSDPDTPFLDLYVRIGVISAVLTARRSLSVSPSKRRRHNERRGIATACALNRRAKSSGRKTKIGSPTQLRACLFGRDVSVGLRDVVDARVAVVDGQQSGIGRRIHMNGRRI